MPFNYHHDRQISSVAQRIRQTELRLLMVDEASQLDKQGFALVYTLALITGCPCLLIGEDLAFRYVILFWNKKGKRHV